MKYLTVNQYKRYGSGVSIGDTTNTMLAMMISRAEAAIDGHMGFDLKRGGFEPHQVMLQQAFDQHTRKTFAPNYTIPVRQITRYRIQVSNIGNAGAGFFANISPNDCVINNDGNYIEIVPLQAVTYALSPVLVDLGLKPPIIEMDCEVGYYIPTFGEILIDNGDHQTYYATDGFWATSYNQAVATQPNQLPPVPPVLYVNGTTQTSGYTYNAIEGSFTFTTPQSPTATVTADYTKTIPDIVVEACVIQVDWLLSQRNLDKLGLYNYLYQMRSGEQMISYPRATGVTDKGRATESALCDRAAGVLSKLEPIGIA